MSSQHELPVTLTCAALHVRLSRLLPVCVDYWKDLNARTPPPRFTFIVFLFNV